MTELIGWTASAILVATIGKQVHTQWREGSSKGVSNWLFVGQLAASVGFLIYSALVHNWVFVVTNALMVCNALAGFTVVRIHRRRERRRGARGAGKPSEDAPLEAVAS
jgi:uncharacterized protein with PQ loop repeat